MRSQTTSTLAGWWASISRDQRQTMMIGIAWLLLNVAVVVFVVTVATAHQH